MLNNSTISTNENTPYNSSWCGCIPDGQVVTSYTTMAPTYGSGGVNGSTISYTPHAGFVGTDYIAWACYGSAGSECDGLLTIDVVQTIYTPTMGEMFWSPWMAIGGVLLLTLLMSRIRQRGRRVWSVFIGGSAMAALFWLRSLYYAYARLLWHYVIMPLDAFFLRMLLPNATQTIRATPPDMITEQLPHFKLEVLLGCSAIEMTILFMYLLTFWILLTWKQIQHRPLVVIYGLALFVSIAVNILRISSIGWYGEYLVTQGAAVEPIIKAFHEDAGWVLYGAAFVMFVNCLWITNRRAK